MTSIGAMHSEPAGLDVVGQKPRDPQNQILMPVEWRRRLAQHAVSQLADPAGLQSVVEILFRRHDDDDAIVDRKRQEG